MAAKRGTGAARENSAKESGVSCFVFWRFSVLAFQSFVLVLVQGWGVFGRGLARLEPGSPKHRGIDVLLTNERERERERKLRHQGPGGKLSEILGEKFKRMTLRSETGCSSRTSDLPFAFY